MDNQIFQARQKQLTEALQKAALDLVQHMGCASMSIPIPGTTPQLYLVLGDSEAIKRMGAVSNGV